jgi:hypothetical protein
MDNLRRKRIRDIELEKAQGNHKKMKAVFKKTNPLVQKITFNGAR